MENLNTEALIRYIERIEQLALERKGINADIRAVYDEIKQAEMHPGTVKQMVRERALKPEVRADQYRLRNEYRAALGLFADTPLGQAAEPPIADRPKPQTVHQPRPRRERKLRLRLFDGEHPMGAA